jgi:hypothetical protein
MIQQCGLANPGLATQYQHAPAPAADRVEKPGEHVAFALPVDERRRSWRTEVRHDVPPR